MEKLRRKRCDIIVVNGPDAINAPDVRVEILGRDGRLLGTPVGPARIWWPGRFSASSNAN